MIMILSSELLVMPGTVLATAGTGSYIAIALATIGGFGVAWLIGSLCEKRPEYTAPELFSSLLKRPLAIFLALSYAVFWILTAIQVIRQGGELIKVAFLPETPLFIIILTLNCVAGYGAYIGLEGLSRFNTFVIPTIFFTIFSIGLANYNHFQIDYLLPLADKGFGPIFSSAIGPLAFYGQISVLLILSPEIQGIQRKIPLYKAILVTGILLETVMIFILLIGGDRLASHYYFPTLQLARVIFIGNTVRGFDALIMTIWVTAVSVKLAVWFYAIVKILGDLFKLQNRRALLAPLLLLDSMLSYTGISNTLEMGPYLSWIWAPFALLTFEVGIPLILLALAIVKKKHPSTRIS